MSGIEGLCGSGSGSDSCRGSVCRSCCCGSGVCFAARGDGGTLPDSWEGKVVLVGRGDDCHGSPPVGWSGSLGSEE